MTNLDLNINDIWGSIIYKMDIDILCQNIYIYIQLEDEKSTSYYCLIFNNIINFKLKNLKTIPWYKTELTEIYLKRKDKLYFDIILWNENNTIEISCENYQLNLISKKNKK